MLYVLHLDKIGTLTAATKALVKHGFGPGLHEAKNMLKAAEAGEAPLATLLEKDLADQLLLDLVHAKCIARLEPMDRDETTVTLPPDPGEEEAETVAQADPGTALELQVIDVTPIEQEEAPGMPWQEGARPDDGPAPSPARVFADEIWKAVDLGDQALALNALERVKDEEFLEEAERLLADEGLETIPWLQLVSDRITVLRRERAEAAGVPAMEEVVWRGSQKIEVDLTDAEVSEYRRQALEAVAEGERAKQEAKDAADYWKAQITLCDAKRKRLARLAEAGSELRDVPVEERWAPGDPVIRRYRLDTGAEIDSRNPDDRERQRRLSLLESEPPDEEECDDGDLESEAAK